MTVLASEAVPIPRRPMIAVTYSSGEIARFRGKRDMFESIINAGGAPLAIDCVSPVDTMEEIVSRVDGLIISGGGDVSAAVSGVDPDDPLLGGVNEARDANEIAALRTAMAHGIPVFAICRGCQLVNVALGGELYADVPRDFDDSIRHTSTPDEMRHGLHGVTIEPGSTLSRWIGGATRAEVNSNHHQAVKTPAPGARVTAHSDDGLIEAYEIAESNIVAVQWHPEVQWVNDPVSLQLLTSFVAEAEAYRDRTTTDL